MMATSTAKHRFQDEQYLNWIKLGQALILVGDGLRPFCKRVIHEFHDSLKETLGDRLCTARCHAKDIKERTSDGATNNVKCTAEESNEGTADAHEKHNTGAKARRYIHCTDGICDKWLDGIYDGLCGEPYIWNNTDVKMWPKQPWQLAKIFMGKGQQPSSHDPAKTDSLGLLQLIKNCKLFSDCVDRQAAAKVIFLLHTCPTIYHISHCNKWSSKW